MTDGLLGASSTSVVVVVVAPEHAAGQLGTDRSHVPTKYGGLRPSMDTVERKIKRSIFVTLRLLVCRNLGEAKAQR